MRPLKVLTFTTLFPNAAQPRHGIFVENRLQRLVRSGHVDPIVVAPIPHGPFSGTTLIGSPVRLGDIPEHEVRSGIEVWHPRFTALPKIGLATNPLAMARRCRGLAR